MNRIDSDPPYIYKYPVLDVEATARNLRDNCREKSVSVSAISSELNISAQAVYKWFHGETVCDIDHLIALSCMLDESLDDLIIRKTV